ncbi:MAG: biotin/lipoyl-containing protein, partial [Nocardioidaceae bacterium]
MATSVTLPALGESVTEGTVTRWLKQPGDQVAVDEPLLEVSTDKVDTEIPSPVAGTLIEIKVQEDETVEVGAELATIGDEGESAGGGEEQAPAEQAPADEAGAAPAGGEQAEAAPAAETQTEVEPERQTQPQGEVPAARTEPTPPAQETAPGPADTKPEAEASQAGTSPNGGTPITLPALGESVTEGTVTRWLKQVGDDVAVDEPLLEVSTDKVDTEIPSPIAGKLLEIKVQEDETVEVGAELARIGSALAATQPTDAPAPKEAPAQEAPGGDGAPEAASQEDASQTAPEPEPAPAAAAQVQPEAGAESAPAPQSAPAPETAPAPQAAAAPHPTHAAGGDGAGAGAYITPLVRKMAADQGVDLSTLRGTGVGGRIRKQDVLEAAKAQRAAE